MAEYVYIFDFGDKIKAGYSKDIKKRLRTIELSSGVKAKNVFSVEGDRKTEKLLHSWLDNRLEGEFFACLYSDAVDILKKIKSGDITEQRKRLNIQNEKIGYIKYDKLFALLKEKGWNTTRIRKEGLIGQGTLTNLRNGTGGLDHKTIARICKVLNCQPGDIMEYVEEQEE